MRYILFAITVVLSACNSSKLITTPDGVTTSDLETHRKTIYILNRSFEKVDSRSAERFGRTRNGTPASPKIPREWTAINDFEFTSAIEGSWARYYQEPIYQLF